MIKTPYRFEEKLSDQEFQRIGRFACRWSHIEHSVSNCLRRLLDMDPKSAQIMVFPLSLDAKMTNIGKIAKLRGMTPYQTALFEELKPLARAMQYLRNTVLHGVIIDLYPDEPPFFHLRSRGRDLTKEELFGCEDLINYTAHVCHALRLSLGEKEDELGHSYALPVRPPVPAFLPDDCRSLPKEGMLVREDPRTPDATRVKPLA